MPRTNIFDKTLVTTALLIFLLHFVLRIKKSPSCAPLPYKVLTSICPGTTHPWNPFILVWTVVQAFPLGGQNSWFLIGPLLFPASSDYWKGLSLENIVVLCFHPILPDFDLRFSKKEVLKVVDQSMHRHTEYPIYNMRIYTRMESWWLYKWRLLSVTNGWQQEE